MDKKLLMQIEAKVKEMANNYRYMIIDPKGYILREKLKKSLYYKLKKREQKNESN